MKRSEFLNGVGLAGVAMVVAPNLILGQDDKPAAYQKDIVQQFVSAAHSNLPKVRELLAEFPNLIASSHDWGGGDFETAIGAGGHVGNVDIVNFLLENGASPSLHVLTMLGKIDLVKPVIETYPILLDCLGPHGFTLLHHAQKGGDNALDMLAYFDSKGLTKVKRKIY